MTARIGVSALTGRIFRGRTNKAGTSFVGEKQDVTSDVLHAVLEKAKFHGGAFEIEGGGKKWAVTVAPCEGPTVASSGTSEPVT